MNLEAGRQLLHYRLVDKLGEGGMGVVWRAVDTSLDREVAIKVLPATFSADPERLARFEREARLLASLNHPHIAGIHGIHETEGTRFLSMELVPGEDLAEVLARGPLPLARALAVARDVAEGVEAAHDQGVIHRDLKPANVRLTVDGKAKVLDFGLAKAHEPSAGSGDPMQSITRTSAGTVAGMILGTAAYMSPEQASGQAIDRRTDIWSFGVMLYELVSHQRLFAGETISHTLADVLRAPIDLNALPPETPTALRHLLERCLDRDPRRRLRDIGEARIAIEDAIADPTPATGVDPVVPVPGTSSKRQSRLPWIIAGLAVVAAVLGLFANPFTPRATPEPVRRFAVEMPNVGNTRQGFGMVAIISADGTTIITRAGAGTDDMLYSRAIGDFEPKPLEGTNGGNNPVISPDNRWIAFLGGTTLYKIRAGGGARTKIGSMGAAPSGLYWADDGRIYSAWQGKIWRIPTDGGDQEPLTGPELEDVRLSYPHVLPGSKVLLCSTAPAPDRAGRLQALDLETLKLKDLDMVGTDPRYLPTGHVLFAQSNRAFVAAFDVDKLEFTGTPYGVHPRAWIDQNQLQIDVSDNGTVVYLPRAEGAGQALVSVGLDGKQEPLLPGGLPFINFNDLRISRDGRQFLVTVEAGVYLIDLDTQTPTLMTEAGFYPLWSPDGSEIVFSTSRAESYDVYRRPVDLSHPEEILLDEANNLRTMDWTRQGVLVIREEIPDKGMDLRYHETIDTPEGTPLLTGDEDELAPVVSADGKWLAYVSDYSGTDEVYATSFPTAGGRLKVSLKGGTSPTWAPDGSALYYFEGRKLIAVSIETEPRFRVTGREVLFEGDYVQYRWSRQYDIHPDGKRFIMVKNPARGNLEVVTNWFDELRELDD